MTQIFELTSIEAEVIRLMRAGARPSLTFYETTSSIRTNEEARTMLAPLARLTGESIRHVSNKSGAWWTTNHGHNVLATANVFLNRDGRDGD